MKKSHTVKSQKKQYTKRVNAKGPYDYDKITVNIRFDDQCGNGHNTFAITGDTTCRGREDMGGCIHEEIAKHFPELSHLIKWHGVTADGPLYYIENTTFHASERDCWGLLKGETRQIINGRLKLPCWKLEPVNESGEPTKNELPDYQDANERPEGTVTLKYVPLLRIGEGKAADLAAARSTAIWPDATLEQLRDVEALKARLPALMEAFIKDIEAAGFDF